MFHDIMVHENRETNGTVEQNNTLKNLKKK